MKWPICVNPTGFLLPLCASDITGWGQVEIWAVQLPEHLSSLGSKPGSHLALQASGQDPPLVLTAPPSL